MVEAEVGILDVSEKDSTCIDGAEDEEKESWAKECRWPLDAGKTIKQILPQSVEKEHHLPDALILDQGNPF